MYVVKIYERKFIEKHDIQNNKMTFLRVNLENMRLEIQYNDFFRRCRLVNIKKIRQLVMESG